MTPDVTVVAPTYRRPHLLPRLVEALEAQTYPRDRFDVVIVDNASPDDTSECLAKLAASTPLRLRHLVEHRPGPATTRNAGWRATDAELVAFVDDDCVPQPGWLAAGVAAMRADDRIGVLQGHTDKPPGARLGNWTLWRRIADETPYFEGCNIFYRRAALEATGGFDEDISYYGEDTALGWAVLEAGWARGFAADALAYHDVEERGLSYHVKTGLLERNVVRLAKRFPGYRRDAFWHAWSHRPEDAALAIAVAGLVLARWERAALLLVLPYVRERYPFGDRTPWRLFAERVVVDSARVGGMVTGAFLHRMAAV